VWSDGEVAAADAPQPDAEELVAFMRMACHGLRNPLAVASGMLDLLRRLAGDQLDDEALDLLSRSSVAVRRTADMVLGIQRHVGAQHRPLQVVPVDLGEVVEWISEGLDAEQIVVRVDGALPTIVADRDMAEWVVHELLDNARRHADRQGPVTVVIGAEEQDGGWLVTLTDDGVGIPADRRDEAFGEGERLGRVGGGLGLGLTIVHRVMDRHGGDAHLEDAPGGGLRVALTWPA
jgi:signal transduction histidine kinase